MKFHLVQPDGWIAERPSTADPSWYRPDFSVRPDREHSFLFSFLFFCVLFLVTQDLSAQSLHRQFIGGVGGTFVSDQVTYRWTAGEAAINHLVSANGQHRLTEGFQQPVLQLRSTEEYPHPLVELAPNPVADLLRIRALPVKDQTLFLRLVDGQGRVLLAPQRLAGFRGELNFSAYPAGIYLVQVIDEDQRLVQVHKVFKGTR